MLKASPYSIPAIASARARAFAGKPLEKRILADGSVEWVRPDGSKPFTFQSWSDGRQESDDGYRDSGTVGSEGWIYCILILRPYIALKCCSTVAKFPVPVGCEQECHPSVLRNSVTPVPLLKAHVVSRMAG